MFDTKNDIPEKNRKILVDRLNGHLAEALDLALQMKQAHWNVKAPNFVELHELFDAAHEEAMDAADRIAERAAQLGGVAEGTVAIVGKNTTLKVYPMKAVTGEEHLEAVRDALAAFGKSVRDCIDVALEQKDQVTANIFIEIVTANDKRLWFVEAHLQK